MAQLSIGELMSIGIGLGNIAAWSKLIYDTRKNGKNGNGNSKPCPLHSGLEALIETGERQEKELASGLADLRKENHDEHQKINADLRDLAVAVAGASGAAAAAAAAASAVALRKRRT